MTSNSLPKKQTLEQILTKKSHEIWGHFLTIEDAKNCVKEWLQQKHNAAERCRHDVCYECKAMIRATEKLLEELEKEKQTTC